MCWLSDLLEMAYGAIVSNFYTWLANSQALFKQQYQCLFVKQNNEFELNFCYISNRKSKIE